MNGTIMRDASKKLDHELADVTECLKLGDYVREELSGCAAPLNEKAAKRTGMHGVLLKKFIKQPKKLGLGFAGGRLDPRRKFLALAGSELTASQVLTSACCGRWRAQAVLQIVQNSNVFGFGCGCRRARRAANAHR